MSRGTGTDLILPPGCVYLGTPALYKGTWRQTRGVRFVGPGIEPIRQDLLAPVSGTPVQGIIRSILIWANQKASPNVQAGSVLGIWRLIGKPGATPELIIDVTPVGFTTGDDGEPDLWHIDYSQTAGGCYAVFEGSGERTIYRHVENGDVSPTPMEPLPNAPSAKALVCSYITGQPPMAIQAGGSPRAVAWSDNEDHENWAADIDNNAGEIEIAAASDLICGRRFLESVLIWSATELHVMQFFSGEYAQREAGKCLLAGPKAIAVTELAVFWLGVNDAGQVKLYAYDGASVRNLECSVVDFAEEYLLAGVGPADKTFNARKIVAQWKPTYKEVWWTLPIGQIDIGNGVEDVQASIVYDYDRNLWWTDLKPRSEGVPLMTAQDSVGIYDYGAVVSDEPEIYFEELADTFREGRLTTNLVEADPDRYTNLQEIQMNVRGAVDIIYAYLYKRLAPTEDADYTPSGQYTNADFPTLTKGRLPMRDSSPYGFQIELGVKSPNNDWRMGRGRMRLAPGARRR